MDFLPPARVSQARSISSRWLLLIVISAAFFVFIGQAVRAGHEVSADPTAANVKTLGAPGRLETPTNYGKLPLTFARNLGQLDRRVNFAAHGSNYAFFLTANEAVFALRRETPDARAAEKTPAPATAIVRMKLVGGNRRAQGDGVNELPGKLNYFRGTDRHNWRTDVPAYAEVRYRNVYPGIDLVYHGNQQQVEYDFAIAPGKSPERIRLAFTGVQETKIEADGSLVLSTPAGDLRQHKPTAFQESSGIRSEIPVSYKLVGDSIAFAVGTYDKSLPLVIDPVIVYSSFLGGDDNDQALGVAVDAQGNTYITGSTAATNFPLVGPAQNTLKLFGDAFVTKINPAGTAIIYSTYLGGPGDDVGYAIAVDSQGSAYVVGSTGSTAFPVTAGALQTVRGDSGEAFAQDGFAAKLSPSGSSLVYATYLGGLTFDSAQGVAVDASGRAYVVGYSDSVSFAGAAWPSPRAGNPVYKSVNNGGSWAGSAAGLTSSVVNFLSFDPLNSNNIYAATDYGVFKSTDGAAHWNLNGGPTAQRYTYVVAIDPINPLNVYAATSDDVYKSTDGGTTYVSKPLAFTHNHVISFAIDPVTPTTLYASTNGTVLKKSINGGDSWTTITTGLPGAQVIREIAINPANTAVVYIGTSRGMFKSTNGGSSWSSINTGALAPVNSINALALDPSNPSTLYAGTFFASTPVVKTTDGGATWTASSTGLTVSVGGAVNTLAVDPVTPSTLYAAVTGGGVFKSSDSGATWNPANAGFANANATYVAVDRNNPANVYAGSSIGTDAFALRLNPSGSALEYILNPGGNDHDVARGVALDAAGNAYVVGSSYSQNFPVVNAFQSVTHGAPDAFFSKIDSAGQLTYSTYLGGSNLELGRSVAVHDGHAYVAGQTNSTDFPVANPLKAAPTSSDSDAFVTKFSTSGATLDFSTCIGGNKDDQAFGLAVDSTGGSYVAGSTTSIDFPTVAAPQPSPGGSTDGFLTMINSSGSALVYSTYIGGTLSDTANAVAVDATGNAYVVGATSSTNFPTVGPFQPAIGLSGFSDAFITKFGIQVDLSITKKESRDPVMVNNPLTYAITVSNNSGPQATGVKVTDSLPAGLTFVSATPTQGTCAFSNPTLTCDLGAMSAGTTQTITLAVTPTSVGTVSNTATVQANQSEISPANNTSTETTKVSQSPSINGRVKDGGAVPINGVQINLTGTKTATRQTDANGYYQFAELAAGGTYTVTPNSSLLSFDPEQQTFNALSADQTADFLATTCSFDIAPIRQSFSSAGGAGSIAVTTLHGCPWSASTTANWITITSGSGVGNGTVNFSVSQTTAPRVGQIVVAGKTFVVYQEFNSCGTAGFSVANYYLGGTTSVQVADLNGDDRRDLIEVNGGVYGSSRPVAVLLNSDSGVFTPTSFDSGLSGFNGFRVAEFNGDNRPDIALTNFNSLFVRIFYNNGSGGFGSFTDYPISLQTAGGLLAGDFNRDGKTDLLVGAFNRDLVQVLMANGSGGFTQTNLTIGSNTAMLAVADVNDDANPDLLLQGPSSAQPLVVRLGDGAGGFGNAILSSGFLQPSRVVTGDFDGDGKLDIAASGGKFVAPSTTVPGVAVLLGNGAGQFTLKSSFDASPVSDLTAADFNSDGKSDVAFTSGENFLTVLLGDGTGRLGSAQQITTETNNFGGGNFGIVAADLLGDFKPDLAVANYNYTAAVLRNVCNVSPSISGRVTDSRNTGGLGGVTVTLGGAGSAAAVTDSNGNYFIPNLTAGASYVVTPTKDNFTFSPVSINVSNLSGNRSADFVGTPTAVYFAQIHYTVEENANSVQVSVTRAGNLSGVSTVEYTTVNGTASDRSDFTTARGTLRFAPGESSKSFNVLLTDDALVEGWESLSLTLSDPVGAILGTPQLGPGPSTVLMEIHDNDSNASAPNPLANSNFFVRQHYHDFLNREPDAPGLQFWADQIESCGADAGCREVRRINVSAAFFLSIEFQETGYLAYRMYNAAYGDATSPNVPGTVPIVRFQDFLPDSQQIGQGVQVGVGNWQKQLEDNKVAYAVDFVTRPRFINAFPLSMTAAEFVAKLDQTTKGILSNDDKAQLITLLGATPADAQKRASAMRQVADDAELRQRELNRAFVLMQYYGYMRRNPDDPQDTDFTGWRYWLDKLESFGGNYVTAEMVKSFLDSTEYRQRFGTP